MTLCVFFPSFPQGQKTEDEPATKKAKLTTGRAGRQEFHSSRSGDAPPVSQQQVTAAYQQQVPQVYQQQDPLTSQQSSYQSNMEANVPEPQAHPYKEDPNVLAPPAQTPAPVTPTVSSVCITRRDPRMARHGSGVTIAQSVPEKPTTTTPSEPQSAPASAPVEVGQKGPLPMPPALPSLTTGLKPAKTRCLISSGFIRCH